MRTVEIGMTPARTLATEAIATGFLLIAVVGSGIMGERLSGGNASLALLANAIATGCALVAIIIASGAQMNPVVTLAAGIAGELPWQQVPARIGAEIVGGVAGVWIAHFMFSQPLWQVSHHTRSGSGQWVAEVVATFGLLAVIGGSRRHGLTITALAVAAYITGAYWFTASTSFANPAVTIARGLTDSFAGIRPLDIPGFVAAQLVGLALALPTLGGQPGKAGE
jgi:glycerol uptake facilitator-like aquaporin